MADLMISSDLPVEPLSLPPDLVNECHLAIKTTYLPGERERERAMGLVTQLHF